MLYPYINKECFYFIQSSPSQAQPFLQFSFSQRFYWQQEPSECLRLASWSGSQGWQSPFPRGNWQHSTLCWIICPKKLSVWHGKGPVLLQRLTGEEGNRKGDGEHIGSSISLSTAQSVARAAGATKPCSKSCIYSLFPLPKQMPCEMPSKAAVWESSTFSSTLETANVPYADHLALLKNQCLAFH